MTESLNSRVSQFEADIAIAHQLVHAAGGEVLTESGPLRTFAKLQADLEAELNAEITLTSAAQSKLDAESAAASAAADAIAAEAARDAALLSVGVYPDLAAGQAGTAEGQYFSVPSPDSAEHLVLYRRTAAGADEAKRYPSASALTAAQDTASAVQLAMVSLAASVVGTQAEVVEMRNDLDAAIGAGL